jgi:hypothetical protein
VSNLDAFHRINVFLEQRIYIGQERRVEFVDLGFPEDTWLFARVGDYPFKLRRDKFGNSIDEVTETGMV